MPTDATNEYHIGFDRDELATSPYAKFFKPVMVPLPEHVRQALLTGAVSHDLMPPVEQAGDLQNGGYWPIETGYTLSPDGAMRVFALTEMPGVTPAMWDWWFAWHSGHAQRYKLWHPQAHLHASWQDGCEDSDRYVGRTSNVVEYIGPTCTRLSIRFVAPASLGLDEKRLASAGETAICARGSATGTPIEASWLIHYVRPVEGGSEMRSRFWIAGNNLRPHGMNGSMGRLIGRALSSLKRPTSTQAAELLVHCSQEMSHMAGILPELYATFGKSK